MTDKLDKQKSFECKVCGRNDKTTILDVGIGHDGRTHPRAYCVRCHHCSTLQTCYDPKPSTNAEGERRPRKSEQ